jgi:hypothetical protein
VRQAIDQTATAPDERVRLGLRLALVDQGPNTPWLIAIVNRGTESVRVVPDLRTLSLEVTAPTPEASPGKRAPRAPKPVTCTLPRDLFPSEEDLELEQVLRPGEGLVDSFDPRLYCLPKSGVSPLVPRATVVGRLGWTEKTKTVWKKGKREQVVLEQTAPFLARRDMPEGTLPAAPPAGSEASADHTSAPRSDAEAIKQLIATPITLGDEYQKPPPPSEPEPVRLVLSRGSDARTEADATITVALVNSGKKSERFFFRRELVSFEVSGPSEVLSCEPGPDERAPDRGSLTTLRPGGRISAVSRLIELCPQGAFRRPGLYLVHARYDSAAVRDAKLPAFFQGTLLSREPVVVRIHHGWGELKPQRRPERVEIGQ